MLSTRFPEIADELQCWQDSHAKFEAGMSSFSEVNGCDGLRETFESDVGEVTERIQSMHLQA